MILLSLSGKDAALLALSSSPRLAGAPRLSVALEKMVNQMDDRQASEKDALK